MIPTVPVLPTVSFDKPYLDNLNWTLTQLLRDMAKEINRVGGATWDGNHPILGQYHIWVDATGAARIKSTPPTSDLDGSLIGGTSTVTVGFEQVMLLMGG